MYKNHSFQLWKTKLACNVLSRLVSSVTTYTAKVGIDDYKKHSASFMLLILYESVK
jgi:hypothetical protein